MPFSEMVIEATSRVELLDTDPLSYRPLRARSTIPLVWMPWHSQVLQPFLLPPELPESELTELVEYAMSFVERNDSDLLDTLLDINHSIYSEYRYTQGATTVDTTPFEVYAGRKGVCQDFSNLFICLAPPDEGKKDVRFAQSYLTLNVLDNRKGFDPDSLNPLLLSLGAGGVR